SRPAAYDRAALTRPMNASSSAPFTGRPAVAVVLYQPNAKSAAPETASAPTEAHTTDRRRRRGLGLRRRLEGGRLRLGRLGLGALVVQRRIQLRRKLGHAGGRRGAGAEARGLVA